MPRANAIDWSQIKARYVAGDMSLNRLAQECGVGYREISRRSKEEQWPQCRVEYREKAANMALDDVQEDFAMEIRRLSMSLLTNARKLSAKIDTLVDGADGMSGSEIRSISGSLRDLMSIIQGFTVINKQRGDLTDESQTGIIILPEADQGDAGEAVLNGE